jgi:hypothetical protein
MLSSILSDARHWMKKGNSAIIVKETKTNWRKDRGKLKLTFPEHNEYYSIALWDVISHTSVAVCRHFGGTYSLHLQEDKLRKQQETSRVKSFFSWLALLGPWFLLAACLAYSLALDMKLIRCSKKSVSFYRTIRRCIQENSSRFSHRCENLKFKTHRLLSKFKGNFVPLFN